MVRSLLKPWPQNASDAAWRPYDCLKPDKFLEDLLSRQRVAASPSRECCVAGHDDEAKDTPGIWHERIEVRWSDGAPRLRKKVRPTTSKHYDISVFDAMRRKHPKHAKAVVNIGHVLPDESDVCQNYVPAKEMVEIPRSEDEEKQLECGRQQRLAERTHANELRGRCEIFLASLAEQEMPGVLSQADPFERSGVVASSREVATQDQDRSIQPTRNAKDAPRLQKPAMQADDFCAPFAPEQLAKSAFTAVSNVSDCHEGSAHSPMDEDLAEFPVSAEGEDLRTIEQRVRQRKEMIQHTMVADQQEKFPTLSPSVASPNSMAACQPELPVNMSFDTPAHRPDLESNGRQQGACPEHGNEVSPAQLEAQLYEHLDILQNVEEELAIADRLAAAKAAAHQQQQAMMILQQQEREAAAQAHAAHEIYFNGVLEQMQQHHVAHMRELELGIQLSREELALNRQTLQQQLDGREQLRLDVERAEQENIEFERNRLERERRRLAEEQLNRECAERERIERQWRELDDERREQGKMCEIYNTERAEIQREREQLASVRERLEGERLCNERGRIEQQRFDLTEESKRLEREHAHTLAALDIERERLNLEKEKLEHERQELQKQRELEAREHRTRMEEATARFSMLTAGSAVSDPIVAPDLRRVVKKVMDADSKQARSSDLDPDGYSDDDFEDDFEAESASDDALDDDVRHVRQRRAGSKCSANSSMMKSASRRSSVASRRSSVASRRSSSQSFDSNSKSNLLRKDAPEAKESIGEDISNRESREPSISEGSVLQKSEAESIGEHVEHLSSEVSILESYQSAVPRVVERNPSIEDESIAVVEDTSVRSQSHDSVPESARESFHSTQRSNSSIVDEISASHSRQALDAESVDPVDEISDGASNVSHVSSGLSHAHESIHDSIESVGNLKHSAGQMSDGMSNVAESIVESGGHVASIKDSFDEISDGMSNASQSIRDPAAHTNSINASVDQISDGMSNVSESIRDPGANTKSVNASVDHISDDTSNVDESIRESGERAVSGDHVGDQSIDSASDLHESSRSSTHHKRHIGFDESIRESWEASFSQSDLKGGKVSKSKESISSLADADEEGAFVDSRLEMSQVIDEIQSEASQEAGSISDSHNEISRSLRESKASIDYSEQFDEESILGSKISDSKASRASSPLVRTSPRDSFAESIHGSTRPKSSPSNEVQSNVSAEFYSEAFDEESADDQSKRGRRVSAVSAVSSIDYSSAFEDDSILSEPLGRRSASGSKCQVLSPRFAIPIESIAEHMISDAEGNCDARETGNIHQNDGRTPTPISGSRRSDVEDGLHEIGAELHTIMLRLQSGEGDSASVRMNKLQEQRKAAEKLMTVKQELIEERLRQRRLEEEEKAVQKLMGEALALNVDAEVQRQLQVSQPKVDDVQQVDCEDSLGESSQADEELLQQLRADVVAKDEQLEKLRRKQRRKENREEEKRQLETQLIRMSQHLANFQQGSPGVPTESLGLSGTEASSVKASRKRDPNLEDCRAMESASTSVRINDVVDDVGSSQVPVSSQVQQIAVSTTAVAHESKAQGEENVSKMLCKNTDSSDRSWLADELTNLLFADLVDECVQYGLLQSGLCDHTSVVPALEVSACRDSNERLQVIAETPRDTVDSFVQDELMDIPDQMQVDRSMLADQITDLLFAEMVEECFADIASQSHHAHLAASAQLVDRSALADDLTNALLADLVKDTLTPRSLR